MRVLDDDPTLAAYASSTASWSTLPAAVLRPHTRGEVEALVRIAAARRIALYPVSTGRNWGYGDACAPGAGQVIVDLSGMNRIREVDARLAYVVIEPGVTQQQLSQYLLSEDLPLWMDSTGAMTTQADIAKKDVTLSSITAASKTYDGNDTASITAGAI
eukprot:gene30124-37286_t